MRASGFRCGFAAVVGRPNVGKSTLVNRLVGQKLSITSRKPQTTRHRILGIKTTPRTQCIYVDTPGIHPGRGRALNRYMNRAAVGALPGVDVVLFLVEASEWTARDAQVLERLAGTPAPIMLVLNKIDLIGRRERLLPAIEDAAGRGEFAEVVPVSARRGTSMERLERLVEVCLPVGPPAFPEAQLTDRNERFLAAEIVREKLTRRLGQELPYRLSVEIEGYAEEGTFVRIGALIWVEQAGQKAIVIGNQGRILKAIGTQARRDLERLLGRKVHLDLWVKVKEGWSDSERALRGLGYVE